MTRHRVLLLGMVAVVAARSGQAYIGSTHMSDQRAPENLTYIDVQEEVRVTVEPQPRQTTDEILKFIGMLRDEIRFEHQLIANRLSASLTVQPLLVGASTVEALLARNRHQLAAPSRRSVSLPAPLSLDTRLVKPSRPHADRARA
jgi:hypothetical protein